MTMNKFFFYVTSGERKYEEIKDLIPEGIRIKKVSFPYPEIQSGDTEKVSLFGACWLANKKKLPVIVDDMGLYIDFLDGFPGPLVKIVAEKLGPEKILKLMKNTTKREAYFKVSLGFCEPGNAPAVFSGIREGRISDKIMPGPYNLGLNSIFVSGDSEKSLAQFDFSEKLTAEPRREAFLKLINFLKNKS